MVKVLTYPYTPDYYWWAPIELLRRMLFIICVAISPGNLVSVYNSITSSYLNVLSIL